MSEPLYAKLLTDQQRRKLGLPELSPWLKARRRWGARLEAEVCRRCGSDWPLPIMQRGCPTCAAIDAVALTDQEKLELALRRPFVVSFSPACARHAPRPTRPSAWQKKRARRLAEVLAR